MGWTSIYQLFWGSLGTRVLTHPQMPTESYRIIRFLWTSQTSQAIYLFRSDGNLSCLNAIPVLYMFFPATNFLSPNFNHRTFLLGHRRVRNSAVELLSGTGTAELSLRNQLNAQYSGAVVGSLWDFYGRFPGDWFISWSTGDIMWYNR